MKYKLIVRDPHEWLNSVFVMRDEEDILILSCDFKPKYLSFVQLYSGTERGVSAMPDENTLHAELKPNVNYGTCEILVDVKGNTGNLSMVTQHDGYSCDIVLYKERVMNKIVWKRKTE